MVKGNYFFRLDLLLRLQMLLLTLLPFMHLLCPLLKRLLGTGLIGLVRRQLNRLLPSKLLISILARRSGVFSIFTLLLCFTLFGRTPRELQIRPGIDPLAVRPHLMMKVGKDPRKERTGSMEGRIDFQIQECHLLHPELDRINSNNTNISNPFILTSNQLWDSLLHHSSLDKMGNLWLQAD